MGVIPPVKADVQFPKPPMGTLYIDLLKDPTGRPLDVVFRIVNEETRQDVENPAARAISEGVIVGLANHTLLVARDGKERPVDDSAAPIRSKEGQVIGSVLVFRDISERRRLDNENVSRLRDARQRHSGAVPG